MACILVVDDEEFVRATLRQMLEKTGHQVFEAANGIEALCAFEKHEANLVIIDIIMPEKEGIETIMELRQRKPGLKIIAMSGGGRTGNTQYLHLAKSFGANNILPKPFKMGEVDDLVNRTMAQA
jgi:CheY-like chemotaxis protein